MKKILTILKSAGLIVGTPIVATTSSIPVLVSGSDCFQESNARHIVPPNYLKKSNDGKTLLGFESFVTPALLRKGNYNTIVIPKGITHIAPYAFAFMFDGVANGIKNIDLDTDLVEIGLGAFERCYGIEQINNFKDCLNLQTIDQDAFAYCKNLSTNLEFPRSLTTIGKCSFKNCESLPQITIHESLIKLGDYAFNNCFALSLIMLNNENDNIPIWATERSFAFLDAGTQADMPFVFAYNFITPKEQWQEIFKQNLELNNFDFVARYEETTDDYFLFDDNMETLLGFGDISKKVPPSILKIPDSVKKIKSGAFSNVVTQNFRCRLVLNEGLEIIENNAFYNCSGIIGQLVIPNSVKSIGENAFYGTNISGSLSLPNNDNFVQVAKGAFAETKINKLVIPKNLEAVQIPFGESAFKNCYRLNTIDVTSFSSNQYPRWTTLQPTNLPFENVGNKGLIIYPYNATLTEPINYIGTKFEYIGFPASISQHWVPFEPYKSKPTPFPYDVLGEKAFYVNGNTIVGLKDEYKTHKKDYNLLNIPYGIKAIDNSAFTEVFHDVEVRSVSDKPDTRWQLSFDLGVEKIGDYAFANDELLVGNVEFPTTLTEIGTGAFNGANGIGSYKIPSNVKTIKDYAFTQTKIWSEEPRLKYIDLTDFTSVPTGWSKNALLINTETTGTYYVRPGTAAEWRQAFTVGGNWKFVEVNQ